MGNPWEQESWKEKKNTFSKVTFVFLFFVIITFIAAPEYEKEELTYMTIVLNEKPEFKKRCTGRGGCKYWLELNAKSTNLKVFAIDYKYLKHQQFKGNIKTGDKLRIGVIDEIILTLSKDGIEYLQFEKAQFHKQRNGLFSRYLFSTGFVLSIIPLFFNEQPRIKLGGIESEIPFGWVLGIGLVVCYLILITTIGSNFISGEEFVD